MGSSLYKSLNPAQQEIRLLRIEPGASADSLEALKCELVTESLLQLKEPYYAVSYVWGDPADTEPIHVNGLEFQVTRNLAAFLRWYRTDHMWPRKLMWADAVCIDQGNIDERNSQVQMMGSIYRSAKTTFSWLGPTADDSVFAMESIRHMSIFSIAQRDANEVLRRRVARWAEEGRPKPKPTLLGRHTGLRGLPTPRPAPAPPVVQHVPSVGRASRQRPLLGLEVHLSVPW